MMDVRIVLMLVSHGNMPMQMTVHFLGIVAIPVFVLVMGVVLMAVAVLDGLVDMGVFMMFGEM